MFRPCYRPESVKRLAAATVSGIVALGGLLVLPAPLASGAFAQMPPSSSTPHTAEESSPVPSFADPVTLLAPLGTSSQTSGAADLDVSLLHDLEVRMCRASSDVCAHLSTLSSTSEPRERLRLDGRGVFRAFWDASADDVAVGDTVDLSIVVQGLEVFRTRLSAISEAGRARPGEFTLQQPVHVRFTVQSHPALRTRQMRAAGATATDVARRLRDEFSLDGVGQVFFLYEDVRVSSLVSTGPASTRQSARAGEPGEQRVTADSLLVATDATDPCTVATDPALPLSSTDLACASTSAVNGNTLTETAATLDTATSESTVGGLTPGEIGSGLVNQTNLPVSDPEPIAEALVDSDVVSDPASLTTALVETTLLDGTAAFTAEETMRGVLSEYPQLTALRMVELLTDAAGHPYALVDVATALVTVMDLTNEELATTLLSSDLPIEDVRDSLETVLGLSPEDVLALLVEQGTALLLESCDAHLRLVDVGVVPSALTTLLNRSGLAPAQVVATLDACDASAVQTGRVLVAEAYESHLAHDTEAGRSRFVTLTASRFPAGSLDGVAAALKTVFAVAGSGQATTLLADGYMDPRTVAGALAEIYHPRLGADPLSRVLGHDLATAWPSRLGELATQDLLLGVGGALADIRGLTGPALTCAAAVGVSAEDGAAVPFADPSSGVLSKLDHSSVQQLFIAPFSTDSDSGQGNLAKLGQCLEAAGIDVPVPLLKATVTYKAVQVPGVLVDIKDGLVVGRAGYAVDVLGTGLTIPPASADLDDVTMLPVFAAGTTRWYKGSAKTFDAPDINCLYVEHCQWTVNEMLSKKKHGALSIAGAGQGQLSLVVPSFLPGKILLEGGYLTAPNGGICASADPIDASVKAAIALPHAAYTAVSLLANDYVAYSSDASVTLPTSGPATKSFAFDMDYHRQCGREPAYESKNGKSNMSGTVATEYLASVTESQTGLGESVVSVARATVDGRTSGYDDVRTLVDLPALLNGGYLVALSEVGIPSGTSGKELATLLSTGYMG